MCRTVDRATPFITLQGLPSPISNAVVNKVRFDSVLPSLLYTSIARSSRVWIVREHDFLDDGWVTVVVYHTVGMAKPAETISRQNVFQARMAGDP